MGFIILTALFVIMGRWWFEYHWIHSVNVSLPLPGFAYDGLTAIDPSRKAFVFLYCLATFFQNFDPNGTTFVIPGKAFPTRYCAPANGITAAIGELGAVVAQVGFAHLKKTHGPNRIFVFTGVFSTILLPETKGVSLESLSNEDQEGFVRGKSFHAPFVCRVVSDGALSCQVLLGAPEFDLCMD
jgi:MFS transporter, PHS family, inorganic phosphate transporter